MRIAIPDFSLVTIIGASGSGKSTFAARHFKATEVVSSDHCRAIVADDESDQSATRDAFDVLYTIAEKRLAGRRLTVIDATNLRKEDRAIGIRLARKFHALPVAIVLNTPTEISIARNAERENRKFGAGVVRGHADLLRKSLPSLRKEGYRSVYVLDSQEQIDSVEIVREPLYNDKRELTGPFDIIGDIHGCYDELVALLDSLGYHAQQSGNDASRKHPAGRRVIFLGDLVDRGPKVVQVLQLVMAMVENGQALCVPGNHEVKLGRKLEGKNVNLTHGLMETLEQFAALDPVERETFIPKLQEFIRSLISHYWLDGGKLVVAHAGLREEMHGRGSGEVREFALYGETTGESDEFGLPIRYDWAAEYRGKAAVVYGHTPVPNAEWVNNTICLDTGCVFGGKLTAMRYPERELVEVAAHREYAAPIRPLQREIENPQSGVSEAQLEADTYLHIADVSGKRRIETRYESRVFIAADQSAAALETISRFCVDPRWMIHLPPTMSPPETSELPDFLEYPTEAFKYYRKHGITRVVLEEKHMGSRAVIVVARDAAAAKARFGVDSGTGVIMTRTGRRFFAGADEKYGEIALDRLRAALQTSGFWERHETNWVCLDCEIMPWSVKAQSLVDDTYRPAGEAASESLTTTAAALRTAQTRGVDIGDSLVRVLERLEAAKKYSAAYQRYVRPVASIDDITIAPFHVLATEASVNIDRSHLWHMEEIARIVAADPTLLQLTNYRAVDLNDEQQYADAIAWWLEMTEAGGEGMVVKPEHFVARAGARLLQPAIKVRGREYLRIIYGPEYTTPEYMQRLRERAVAAKRKLALQEFSLGLESLHRFVEHAPLRRIHECAFGVLALESEPIDPRL